MAQAWTLLLRRSRDTGMPQLDSELCAARHQGRGHKSEPRPCPQHVLARWTGLAAVTVTAGKSWTGCSPNLAECHPTCRLTEDGLSSPSEGHGEARPTGDPHCNCPSERHSGGGCFSGRVPGQRGVGDEKEP